MCYVQIGTLPYNPTMIHPYAMKRWICNHTEVTPTVLEAKKYD